MAIEKQVCKRNNLAEQFYGFAQAVRVGDTVWVAGQTAMREDMTVAKPDDMADQMTAAYREIAGVLETFGATMDNVVEEVLYVTDVGAAATVALDVRREFYGDAFEVASSLVQVTALGSPEIMIEIKAVAKL